MGIWKEIFLLIRKDLVLELRNSYAIGGTLLYIFSTIFLVYFSFVEVNAAAWNTLFWIIGLFVAVNAVGKSFLQENSRVQMYYYTLVSPLSVILAKILYNILLLLLLLLLAWAAFGFVTGSPVKDYGQFFLAILLGSVGFSITFTFISAISGKASNNATLMAILSFPLILPILTTLLKLTANASRLMQDTGIARDIWILVGIDLFLLAIALVLFPFLWRE